jgi:hypothetical protein
MLNMTLLLLLLLAAAALYGAFLLQHQLLCATPHLASHVDKRVFKQGYVELAVECTRQVTSHAKRTLPQSKVQGQLHRTCTTT